MILADTSIWIDYFRRGNEDFATRLKANEIYIHPFIIGEIACGDIKNRWETLQYFKTLNSVDISTHEEVLIFIDMYNLHGMGLGYIDAHLLASAKLSAAQIWTLDKRFKNAAAILLLDFKG